MIPLTPEVARYLSNSLRDFKRMPQAAQGTYYVILAAAIYGFTLVLTKGALTQLPPFTLLFIQTSSSVAFFWTIIVIRGIQVPLHWDVLKYGLAGLLEPGLSYIFGVFGLSLTSASDAALIGTTEPIATLVLSWLILRERIRLPFIGLGVLACMGVSWVAAPEAASMGQGTLWGTLLVCLSVLFASLYAITTAHSVKQLHPVVLAAIQQTAALVLFGVMLLGAWALGLESVQFTSATWGSVGVAIASGAFGYGLAFLLYLAAVRHQSASRISLYLTLTPVFGVIGAYLFLGERLMLSQGLGGSLILLAVMGLSQLPQEQ
ncbi:MAG: DMT family transporter [Oculatellaceae cyanobacterium Prado106]|jgi:drug/metabolite transporter (DMT)-like permease|nr:DMT family transporter [Oculatellaceae cyanobacterium Prado106]